MNKPIKEKYLDEYFGGPYYIFGSHPNGEVDVESSRHGTIITLPKEDAEKVVELHKEFMTKIYNLLGYPETRTEFYCTEPMCTIRDRCYHQGKPTLCGQESRKVVISKESKL